MALGLPPPKARDADRVYNQLFIAADMDDSGFVDAAEFRDFLVLVFVRLLQSSRRTLLSFESTIVAYTWRMQGWHQGGCAAQLRVSKGHTPEACDAATLAQGWFCCSAYGEKWRAREACDADKKVSQGSAAHPVVSSV